MTGGGEMDLRELPVDDLVLDETLNLRDRLDQETVERYDEAWDRMPPVTVFEVDGRWLLTDGFHRHASAIRRDRRTITAEIRVGTHTEALDYAATINLSHGLPLTRAERRRVVETRLRIHPDWSDRRLAEEMGIGREMIARVRKQLVDAGQLPASSVRVGADGKTYPATSLPRDPNEHLPRDKNGAGEDGPRDRARGEADAPWDDTVDPMPSGAGQGRAGAGYSGASAPWDDATAKAVALAPPVAVAAPSIDEMLGMMTDQIHEMLNWTDSAEFAAAYRDADYTVRSRFDNAVVRLDERVNQLSAKMGRG